MKTMIIALAAAVLLSSPASAQSSDRQQPPKADTRQPSNGEALLNALRGHRATAACSHLHCSTQSDCCSDLTCMGGICYRDHLIMAEAENNPCRSNMDCRPGMWCHFFQGSNFGICMH
jgi:hypothetical protein